MSYNPNNPNGQATSANSAPVTLSTEQQTILSAVATSAKQDLLLTELQLKADLSETQPVSLASVPLPTGASTSALQTAGNASLSNIDTNTDNLDVALSTRLKPADTLTRVETVGTVTAITNALPTGTNTIGKVQVDGSAIISGNRTSYWPNYGSPDAIEVVESSFDTGGALVTRSAILTDEGTYRINFANTSLAVSIGTITSIVGNIITGSGFSTVDVHLKDYFKLNADPETSWRQIKSVDSDTQITLYDNYVGGSSGDGSISLVQPLTGAGATITVLNGQGIITAGTTNNAVSFLNRSVDYGPLVFRTRLSISQRIVNQNIIIGLSEGSATPRWFARFRCDGAVSTVNTAIICESARNPTTAPSVAETESTTVTIPNGGNTSQFLEYRIEQLSESVRFYINNILVTEHTKSMPSPYDFMASGIRIENVGVPASSTIITINYVTTKNHNKIETGFLSEAEKVVAVQPPLAPYNFTQAGVIAINTDLLIIDCLQLRTVNLQATSIGTTGRLDFFLTNDLSVTGTAQPAYPIGGGAGVVTSTTVGNWNIPTNGARYLRVRLGVATTAGTTTLFATDSNNALPLPAPTTQPISGSVTASGTIFIGNTANTTPILANVLIPVGANTGDTGAKVATGNGATQTNVNAKGANIVINLGAVTGTTPTAVFKVQYSSDAGTTWLDLPNATTATLTATGVYGITIYPGITTAVGTATAGSVAQVNIVLPRTWRLVWTIGGTTPSFTITNVQVTYNL